jgi:uncharacterized protein YecE (DUF72 family)
MRDVRIGTSGWVYPPWRGEFYPAGLAHRRELEYLSSRLRSVELNGSFYPLQRPDSYRTWRHDAGRLRVRGQGARFITHMRKLREPETPLANFFASGLLALGAKLGPVLWQLPPTMRFEPDVLAAFLVALPRDTEAAAALATRYDERLAGRALTVTDARDLVYVRLHGDAELYTSGYTPEALRRWAEKIRDWRRAHDVHVYFDNDVKVRAPADAMALTALLDDP